MATFSMRGYSVSRAVGEGQERLTEEIHYDLGLLDFRRGLHQWTVDDEHAGLSGTVSPLLRFACLRFLLDGVDEILHWGYDGLGDLLGRRREGDDGIAFFGRGFVKGTWARVWVLFSQSLWMGGTLGRLRLYFLDTLPEIMVSEFLHR